MKKQLQKPWYLLIAAAVVALYFVISNLLQLLGYKIIPELIKFSLKDQNEAMMYVNGVDITVSILLLLIVYIVYRKLKKEVTGEQVCLDGTNAIKCVIAGIALAGISFLISTIFGWDIKSTTRTLRIDDVIMLIVTSVIFAPLIEEFLFRGILFNILSKFKQGWVAIVLSAAAFAVYHWDMIQGVFTFIMGIVFAYTYNKTKNIKYAILLHAANNAFVSIAGYVLPTGMRPFANWLSVIMFIPMVIFVIVEDSITISKCFHKKIVK